jgi:hypothetical protein
MIEKGIVLRDHRTISQPYFAMPRDPLDIEKGAFGKLPPVRQRALFGDAHTIAATRFSAAILARPISQAQYTSAAALWR